jgi:hypothetical protein
MRRTNIDNDDLSDGLVLLSKIFLPFIVFSFCVSLFLFDHIIVLHDCKHITYQHSSISVFSEKTILTLAERIELSSGV